MFSSWLALAVLIMNGMVVGAIWVPSGRVTDCTLAMPGTAKTALASLFKISMSAGIAHVMIGLDHQ